MNAAAQPEYEIYAIRYAHDAHRPLAENFLPPLTEPVDLHDAPMPLVGMVIAPSLPGYHLVRTCSMGPASNPGAVVGTDLRVHGMERLCVVDASIIRWRRA